jgi:hypothetical protein
MFCDAALARINSVMDAAMREQARWKAVANKIHAMMAQVKDPVPKALSDEIIKTTRRLIDDMGSVPVLLKVLRGMLEDETEAYAIWNCVCSLEDELARIYAQRRLN